MEYKLKYDLLSRAECNALRGLAILGIFLHNYCHWLGAVVKENEYQYFQRNVDWLHAVMAQPDWLLPMHLMSFFGHYGVPIFLFLSAYGLEKKYNNTPSPTRSPIKMDKHEAGAVGSFIAQHYLKLFKMMFAGFVCFIIVDAITPGRWHYSVTQIVAQLGMFNNLLPEPDRNIWPGPYWFFGLMMQLYIVYRLLIYRRHWGWTVGLMVICIGVQMHFAPESEELNRYRYNFMGGMLPFGMGVLFARFGEKVILFPRHPVATLMCFLVSAWLVEALSNSYYGWVFVPVFVIEASIYFVKLAGEVRIPGLGIVLFRLLEWLGVISAALFVIHPVLRKIFIPISRQGDMYAGLLLYVIACIGVAAVFPRLSKGGDTPKPQS